MTSPTPRPTSVQPLVLGAAAAVIIGLIAAAVLLGLKGWTAAEIGALLTAVGTISVPVVAALRQLVDLHAKQDAQTETIGKIDHQTNGILTKRIRDAVREELSAPIPYALEDDDPQ